MGGGDNSRRESTSIQFGNQSGYNDLSSLFGGNRVFNLGAGSSSFDINTNSIDLSSFLRGQSGAASGDSGGGEGGGFDVAASVGVGVGGGSGSGGQVDKATQNPLSFLPSGGGSNNNMPLYITLGVVGVGVLLIVLTAGRRR